MPKTWQHPKVIVEVPVLGNFSSKDLAWAVQRALEADGFWQDRKYLPKKEQPVFGKVRVKQFNLVIAKLK